jgi:transcriptional regulator with XRE-family HTH domain
MEVTIMNIVRELRKRKGIQQKELSIIIGVAQPTVSEWEKNKKDPSGDRLRKLAEYFGVDELVILGKGVVDLTQNENAAPKTEEARILAASIDSLPEEDRKRAVEIFNLMFELNAHKFEGRNDDEA